MKKRVIVMPLLFLLTGLPLCAGESSSEPIVVVDAPPDMDDLCSSLTEMVRANPSQAHDIFRRALESRDSWTDAEVFALYQAVMEGVPDSLAVMQQNTELLRSAITGEESDFSDLNDPIGQNVLTVLSSSSVLDSDQRDRLGGSLSELMAVDAVSHVTQHAQGSSPVSGDVLQDQSAAKENLRYELDVVPSPVPSPVTPAQ